MKDNEWLDDALCKQLEVPTEVFYPEWGDTEAENQAKEICLGGCKAISQCRQDALEHGDFDGVQGGLTGVERARLFNKIKKVRNGRRTAAT